MQSGNRESIRERTFLYNSLLEKENYDFLIGESFVANTYDAINGTSIYEGIIVSVTKDIYPRSAKPYLLFSYLNKRGDNKMFVVTYTFGSGVDLILELKDL